jgi:hypothetical protein
MAEATLQYNTYMVKATVTIQYLCMVKAIVTIQYLPMVKATVTIQYLW